MNQEYTYKGDTLITYATSIAATWIWSPAIFVASSMGFYNGIYGLFWFLLPNALTLILFGYISQKFIKSTFSENFIGIQNILENNDYQKKLHVAISSVLLVASTCVQLVGLNELSRLFCDVDILYSSIAVCFLCYIYTKSYGIKACIISDKYKYYYILFASILILFYSINNISLENVTFFGVNNPKFIDISLSFGIISAIGLLCAPYVDQTFWQRAFSIDRNNVFKTYFFSSLLFIIVPLCFGMIGILNTSNHDITNWNITYSFDSNIILTIFVASVIFLALIATLDSNFCAIESLHPEKKYQTEILMLACILICWYFKPSIVDLFLIYGTLRTSMAIPTILIIYNRYDKKRLFVFSLLSVIVGSGGYGLMSYLNLPYGYIFTILALTIPIFGYSYYSKEDGV